MDIGALNNQNNTLKIMKFLNLKVGNLYKRTIKHSDFLIYFYVGATNIEIKSELFPAIPIPINCDDVFMVLKEPKRSIMWPMYYGMIVLNKLGTSVVYINKPGLQRNIFAKVL